MASEAQALETTARIAQALEPGEYVSYVTGFHWAVHELLIVASSIMVAVAVFSFAVEPGFIRLAILPGILWVAGLIASLRVWGADIVVTNRRVMVVGIWQPTSVRFGEFNSAASSEGLFGHILGNGQIYLSFLQNPDDPDESRWAPAFHLRTVRGAERLSQEIAASSEAAGFSVEVID